MNKVRVAAVGMGWVATHRHLTVMDRSTDFQVIGVIDRYPGRAHHIKLQHRYSRFAETADLTSVPWMDEVEAITVATAPMNHYAVILQALQLGKHVLTEKPFTMTVAEAEDLARIAAEKNLQLGIIHNFQFARSTKRLLKDIGDGTLGQVRGINAVQLGNPLRRLPEWYEKLPFGLMYDESPHLLYLLRCVAQDIRLARCIVHPSSSGLNTPARIDAFFQSSTFSGPIALTCNFESPISEWYLMVFGEKRLGIVDIFRDIYLSLTNDGGHGTANVLRTSTSAIMQHIWQHVLSGVPHLAGTLSYGTAEVFSRFAKAIRGAQEQLLPINSESALAVLRLQHAMIEHHEIVHQGCAG